MIGGALPEKPDDYNLTAREAIELADTDPKVIETRPTAARLKSYAEAKPPFTWQIGYYDGDDEVVQVLVDDPTGDDPRVVDRLPGRLADGPRLRAASSATC